MSFLEFIAIACLVWYFTVLTVCAIGILKMYWLPNSKPLCQLTEVQTQRSIKSTCDLHFKYSIPPKCPSYYYNTPREGYWALPIRMSRRNLPPNLPSWTIDHILLYFVSQWSSNTNPWTPTPRLPFLRCGNLCRRGRPKPFRTQWPYNKPGSKPQDPEYEQSIPRSKRWYIMDYRLQRLGQPFSGRTIGGSPLWLHIYSSRPEIQIRSPITPGSRRLYNLWHKAQFSITRLE